MSGLSQLNKRSPKNNKTNSHSKSEISEIKDLLQQVISQNANLLIDAQSKNNEQFKAITNVIGDIQKQTMANTQESIRLSTLFTSRDRYLFSMGGLISLLMVLVSWVYVSDRTFVSKSLDEIRTTVNANDAKYSAYDDQTSDKMAAMQEEINNLRENKRSGK